MHPAVTHRSRPMGRVVALVAGAALAVTVPFAAYADSVGVTVRTPGATAGPASAFAEITTDAACSSGLISGGGVSQTIGTGTSSNGNKINGTVPSPDGSTEYLASTGVVGTDVTHWLGIGGSGGAVNGSFSSTPYAMCFTSGLVDHTQVVMDKLAGPTAAGTVGLVTATCPAGTRLLGGGARITPASVGSLKPIASFPTFDDSAHGFGRKAAADGETDPDSWTAVGWNGGGGNSDNTTYAYAICSGNGIDTEGATVTVRHTSVSGPTTATSGRTATTGCAEGDGTLVSGGAAISGGSLTTTDFTGPGSVGDHLNGSYPSTSRAVPVTDGTTTAAYWTADAHTGAGSSPNTYTDAWALCADDGI
ncbi:hypothetical protein AB0D99_09280 [Streptomyces sp. NPDC047971]|uniref:hypothetical protein n=1 Tax=Streptomyces sp. NPDC047971 TaxID=3154499 RepID=UPI00340D9BAB